MLADNEELCRVHSYRLSDFLYIDFQSTLKLEPSNMEANMHSARLEVHTLIFIQYSYLSVY